MCQVLITFHAALFYHRNIVVWSTFRTSPTLRTHQSIVLAFGIIIVVVVLLRFGCLWPAFIQR